MTDAIYEAGFGSSSRAYEGAALGMTPSRFAKGGEGEQIGWAAAKSRFGWVVVGATERGLCWLALAGTAAEAECWGLREEFLVEATLRRDPALGRAWWMRRLAQVAGERGSRPEVESALALDLRGTAFQPIAGVAGATGDSTRRDAQLTASLRGEMERAQGDAGRGPGLRAGIAWRWWCRAIAWWG